MTIPGDRGPILEVARLEVIPGREDEFLAAFAAARPNLEATPGFVSLDLKRCIDDGSTHRFLLLVEWESLEAHTIGFRQSGERYERWRQLLHHFYDPFPVVEHYA